MTRFTIPRGQQQHTGIKMVTGETPDISKWIDFEFYDCVWYYDQKKVEMMAAGIDWPDGSASPIRSAVTYVTGYFMNPERLSLAQPCSMSCVKTI
jgi:hypothetical protein